MSPVHYRLLADLVLISHVSFVLFVILGLVLILTGGALRWRWVRNRWFRGLHLAAVAVVVMQAWLGVVCPLTSLENALRLPAGQATYPGSFITYWLHSLLYYRAPAWVFTAIYSTFGLLVLASWLLVRPGKAIETGHARS